MVSEPLSGARTDTQPVTEPAIAKSGHEQQMFGMADWYNRIHITPTTIDLGFVVSDIAYAIEVWNAYLTSKTLSSVLSNGFDGVTLTQPAATPLTYEPLQVRNYTLNVDSVGGVVLSAGLIFNFTGAPTPDLSISGTRILLFPFRPNWQNRVSETLEWKTDVLRAFDGDEQRRSLRVLPRRGLEYDFMVRGENARLFENLMWSWQHRLFAVPLWMYKANLTSPASIGDSTLYLDTTDRGFAVDGLVCIYRSTTQFEVAAADTVSSNQITLKYPLSNGWVAGDRVYPVLVGKPPSSIPTQRHTDDLLTGKASFISSADINDPFLPDTAAPVTYDGKEVVTYKPNWKSGIDNTWMHEFAPLDSGVGAMRWMETETSGRIQRPYGLLLKNKSEVAAFRAFLGRLRGQAKACWIPSWHDDFDVTALTASGGSTLTVGGQKFAEYVGVNTDRDRLAVKLVDGTVFYRKITGISYVGNDTVFQLDAAFTQDVGPNTVSQVYLLLHCRLAGDKVEIPWRTDSVADPQLVFTTIPV